MEPIIKLYDTIYAVVLFILISRMILSFSGRGYGKFYNLIYSWSEKILSPVRRFTPRFGMIDLSPIIVLVGMNIFRSVLVAFILSVREGNPFVFVNYILSSLLSFVGSLITILAIMLIIKIVARRFSNGYSHLANILDRFTYFFTSRVGRYLTFSQKRYLDYISVIILLLFSFVINRIELLIHG
ncbi:MAG: hypothetical protein CR982_04255 [Candidatus Cloacimonadota bacterium]|nr:MAG: hypothetical protein CR982_04255 [Candidatus Cloacimonadota bacterium]PIE78492.1 MAG: hypothetical protein CSA15_07295 [Candidatus Delongbacteria bacterium]